ncbi:beta-1,4 N-acetylgalactosaminyltransferase 2-like isoform X1 [Gopherus evgoodei]|uniref:beta-1,4 N-acetylgalactosaminyltransferase 2-like isoform X1 n=1 Tax=Gopherus evgoodei TaxID=1825980 RepID=UPI0011CF54F7|nr:beta-1,4 N-acetylgalactosaminyltransferase 2-like isoform X1 [Gopherus evgoodei]
MKYYFSIPLLCIVGVILVVLDWWWTDVNQIKGEISKAQSDMKLLSPEKYKSLFIYNGIWLAPKNRCECAKADHVHVYQMEDYIDKKDLASIKERRQKEFEHYQKRYPSMTQDIVIAKPNMPLSYPIQGVEVMPLHTIMIPGLGLRGVTEEKYQHLTQVILRASLGTLNTLADVSDDVVRGRGKKELLILTSDVELLNFILRHVTYTSVVYQLSAVDMMSFKSKDHVAQFPVIIRQPSLPKLIDPGADRKISSLVTITTKTFLRYHKLRFLIKSIRQYYPDIKIIVADDSEVPEKIIEENIEHYIMPFGKGWFAGRNLAISQVTTKYYLWVDDDYLFTENTKIEKLLDVLERTNLDMVGGSVKGDTYSFQLLYEQSDDGDCLHLRYGSFHKLDGFPNCVVTSGVVNFYLAHTDKSRHVSYDPLLQRVAHSEFFVDGLGILLVGSCSDVSVGHQNHNPASDPNLAKIEDQYKTFRDNTDAQVQFKLALHYFKNRLKCYSTR